MHFCSLYLPHFFKIPLFWGEIFYLTLSSRSVTWFLVWWGFFPHKSYIFLTEPDPAEEFTEPTEVESTEVLFTGKLVILYSFNATYFYFHTLSYFYFSM